MTIESLVLCLYAFSGFLFLLSLIQLRTLFRFNWTLPFKLLKLICFSLLSCIFLISALQLSSFNSFETKKPLAKVQILLINESLYSLVITTETQKSIKYIFEIYGDMWQLDMRLLTWLPLVNFLGLDALYRIERVSGRYQSVEDENTQPRSLYSLSEDFYGLALWRFLIRNFQGILVRSNYGAGLYAPLYDQALYGIYLTSSGAEIRPLNDFAETALEQW